MCSMVVTKLHSFHIPVLGISYSIDTPIKVARFGISSVISIMDDELIEKMRQYHSHKTGEKYELIEASEKDGRSRRITAYLNLANKIINNQVAQMRQLPFEKGNDLVKYFDMLPASSTLKKVYEQMKKMPDGNEKQLVQKRIKKIYTARCY